MNPLIIYGAIFLAVSMAIAAVIMLMSTNGKEKAEDRLDVLAGKKRASSDTPAISRDLLIKESMGGFSRWVQGLTERFNNFRILFQQADSPLKPDTFMIISGVAAGFGVIVGIVGKSPAPLYPVFALVFGFMPLMWLLKRRGSRFKKFAKQLPDAMDLLARALRSGHSLASGLHVVVEEMPAPISQEFGIAYEEQNLGIPLENALKNTYKRMPNLDFRFFCTAVAIQKQAGGDLAEILDKISYIIRERFRLLGQVQALTGEGRISGVVLMILPVALFFAVYYLNPDYVMLLFTDPLGRQMIAVAIFLQILGAVAIKKIVNIKV